jgi:hypothetical protein
LFPLGGLPTMASWRPGGLDMVTSTIASGRCSNSIFEVRRPGARSSDHGGRFVRCWTCQLRLLAHVLERCQEAVRPYL